MRVTCSGGGYCEGVGSGGDGGMRGCGDGGVPASKEDTPVIDETYMP